MYAIGGGGRRGGGFYRPFQQARFRKLNGMGPEILSGVRVRRLVVER